MCCVIALSLVTVESQVRYEEPRFYPHASATRCHSWDEDVVKEIKEVLVEPGRVHVHAKLGEGRVCNA